MSAPQYHYSIEPLYTDFFWEFSTAGRCQRQNKNVIIWRKYTNFWESVDNFQRLGVAENKKQIINVNIWKKYPDFENL
jgi:hypothetical protein